jgi:hypothetical protein
MVVRRVLKGAFSEGLKKSFNHYNEGLIMGLNHLHATGGARMVLEAQCHHCILIYLVIYSSG